MDDKLDTLKSKVKGGDSDSEDEKDEAKGKGKKKAVKDNEGDTSSNTSGASVRRSDGALDGAPELFRSSVVVLEESEKPSDSKSQFPTFDAAAPAVTASDDEDDEEDEEDDHDEHAFDHPSTYVDQPWIWLPRDQLGLSELLAADLKAAGVDASDVGASMDGKGIVEVTRNPPDEEWLGGHDK